MLMHWEYLIAGRPRDHKDGHFIGFSTLFYFFLYRPSPWYILVVESLVKPQSDTEAGVESYSSPKEVGMGEW